MTPSQDWDPELYARHARFVSDLGSPVLELLAPRPGERILDLGCGDGPLTRKLIEVGCDVVAVDASADQVEAARRLGIDARVMDGESLDFDADFDAVFSNAALHWMKRPDAVIAGVRRALRPGGRFVAEFGGQGCVQSIRGALHTALVRRRIDPWSLDPWYFPSANEYSERLAGAGFEVRSIELFPRPTPLPTDAEGWLRTFAGAFLAALPPEEHATFVSEVARALEPVLRRPSGEWVVDYVRLRFVATCAG
jgi:SAM-dependent methyltransferase